MAEYEYKLQRDKIIQEFIDNYNEKIHNINSFFKNIDILISMTLDKTLSVAKSLLRKNGIPDNYYQPLDNIDWSKCEYKKYINELTKAYEFMTGRKIDRRRSQEQTNSDRYNRVQNIKNLYENENYSSYSKRDQQELMNTGLKALVDLVGSATKAIEDKKDISNLYESINSDGKLLQLIVNEIFSVFQYSINIEKQLGKSGTQSNVGFERDNQIKLYIESQESIALNSSDGTYIALPVPKKVVNGAISKYATNVSENEILAIWDTTVMENGKTGVLFTNNAVYFTETFEKPRFVKYDNIHSMQIKYDKKGNPYQSKLIFKLKNGGTSIYGDLCVNKVVLENIISNIISLK